MKRIAFITSLMLLLLATCVIASAAELNPLAVGFTVGVLLLVGNRYIPEGVLRFTLTDLKWTQGQQNLGGVVGDLYYCPAEDIATLPDLSAPGVLETATGSNFVCKVGKRFISIYHTAETGKADSNTVGERDGKGIENMFEFLFPGSKLDVKNFERFALNTPCVVIYKNTNGQFEMLGVVNLNETNNVLTTDIPAYLESVTGTTGAGRGDRRGKTFQFKQPGSPHSAVIYKGTIPLTPAP